MGLQQQHLDRESSRHGGWGQRSGAAGRAYLRRNVALLAAPVVAATNGAALYRRAAAEATSAALPLALAAAEVTVCGTTFPCALRTLAAPFAHSGSGALCHCALQVST